MTRLRRQLAEDELEDSACDDRSPPDVQQDAEDRPSLTAHELGRTPHCSPRPESLEHYDRSGHHPADREQDAGHEEEDAAERHGGPGHDREPDERAQSPP